MATPFDDPPPLDRDALIDAIYRTQITLKLCAERLAQDRHPVIDPKTLPALDFINNWLMAQPSTRLH